MQPPTSPAPPVLAARSLTVRRGETPIFEAVDLALTPGQLAWLGGPSGIGKTTLLLALARLLPLIAGELSLDGTAAARIAAPTWRSQVLLVPHPPLALGTSVEEDLLAPYGLGCQRHRARPTRDDLRRELDDLGLSEVGLPQSPEQLSQGQLGRLVLARALLAKPRVLLLDEPTANLDEASGTRVAQRVTEYCRAGGAAVVASHGPVWESANLRLQLPPRAAPRGPS